jgi:hypothetical protein
MRYSIKDMTVGIICLLVLGAVAFTCACVLVAIRRMSIKEAIKIFKEDMDVKVY